MTSWIKKTVFICSLTLMLLMSDEGTHPWAAADNEFSIDHATCETDRKILPYKDTIKGDDVLELQQRLQEIGLYNGPIDGSYGIETQQAVKRLHELRGMENNAIVDQETWLAMAGDSTVTSSASLAPPIQPVSIVIDLEQTLLTVYSKGRPYHSFSVSIGKSETPSPVGEFRIVNKGGNWGGGFGTRWMGLNVPWGIYGIHGTNKPWSIGRAASHGCFRMYNGDVEILYKWIPTGTPVSVVSKYRNKLQSRNYRPGSASQNVVYLQLALRKAGFSPGSADGRYGGMTAQAVMNLHKYYGLPNDGRTNADSFYLLGVSKLQINGGKGR